MKTAECSRPPSTSVYAALLPGGAVVLDGSGRVRLGISDDSLAELVGDAPEFLRLAVAHLAEIGAVEAGLLDAEKTEDGPRGPAHLISPEISPHRDGLQARVLRSAAFLGDGLLASGLGCRERGDTMLLLVETGARSYIGPRLAPDASPCIVCVQRAVAPNRKSEPLVGSIDETPGIGLSDGDALELFRAHSSGRSSEILEVDGKRHVVSRHAVRSFPDCPVCGMGVSGADDRCLQLQSCRKHKWTDTGARISDPAQTFEAYRHLISPLTGAVRRIRRVDVGGSDLIHVFTASHAMTEHADSFSALMRDGRDASGGKGGTADQARVSALCEALERFSTVFRGTEIDTIGTLGTVEGAIDPTECLLFSDRQYDAREEWNPGHSRFQHVPERFDSEAAVAWSRVWCLQTREPAYLPTAYLYFGFQGAGSRYCRADSNGLAAGQTLEEAVLQGFLELVERDSIALWWYNRLRMPEVDVSTFDDTYVARVFDHYQHLGRRAWVLDLTSDLKIPVFAALSARIDQELPEVIFGFGAHLDPSIALRRCVTEMNQMLATVTRFPDQRRRQLQGAFDDALEWWADATLPDNPYLVPDRELGLRGSECFECAWTDDLRDDIQTCLRVADRHELVMYVRDMSRADLGISVARVVVPGLRHFWRRLGPGRLYDAPVAMGRLQRPIPETAMNPISFFV